MALQEAGGTSVLVVYVLLLHPRSYRERERERVWWIDRTRNTEHLVCRQTRTEYRHIY